MKLENICPLEGFQIIFKVTHWNGVTCTEALDYGQICSNASTDNECKYITQETSCIGPVPYKCQCSPGKYFNRDFKKCEMLIEIDEICLQADSCKNGICSGSPLKCQNQWNMNIESSSMATGLSTTTALVGFSTVIPKITSSTSSTTTKSKALSIDTCIYLFCLFK